MIIYIVTEGEYSDYSIMAVFTKEHLAEKYVALKGGSIEKWGANIEVNLVIKLVYPAAILLDTGECFDDDKPYMRIVSRTARSVRLGFWITDKCDPRRWAVRTLSTVSAKHAKKLAVEARQKWIRAGKPDIESYQTKVSFDDTDYVRSHL